MREFERLQLYKDHLEALLVSGNETRSMIYKGQEAKTRRAVQCSGSENEELVLTVEHGLLDPTEKERLHSFSEFSGAQVSEEAYKIPLGKDPRRAATMVEAVFTRIIGAPSDYSVEVDVHRPGDDDAGQA